MNSEHVANLVNSECEQCEQDDEKQGVHRQLYVTDHLKPVNSQRSINGEHVVSLVNSGRVVNSVNKKVKSIESIDSIMSLVI